MRKLLLSILLLLHSLAAAQIIPPPAAQPVRPALTIPRGHLYATSLSRFFFQDQIYELAPNLLTGETYWDIQTSLGALFGITDHWEVALQQILYQDNHSEGRGYNLPDDLFLRLTSAGWGRPEGHLRFGTTLELRFPLGEHHNLPLEPYAADRSSVSLQLLTSRISEPERPGVGTTLSANLGFTFHRDHHLRLTRSPADTFSSRRNSSEVSYGLAAARTFGRFSLQADLYGRAFLRQPAVTAFTRENSLYLAPAIGYTLPSAIRLQLTADLRLSGDADETRYPGGGGSWQLLPTMPQWRLNIGLSLPLVPFTLRSSRQNQPVGPDGLTREELERELQNKLAAERQKTEQREEELARIRAERERIEQRLQLLLDKIENRGSREPDQPAQQDKPEEAPAPAAQPPQP